MGKKISELTNKQTIDGSEMIPASYGNKTYSITPNQLKDYIGNNSNLLSLINQNETNIRLIQDNELPSIRSNISDISMFLVPHFKNITDISNIVFSTSEFGPKDRNCDVYWSSIRKLFILKVKDTEDAEGTYYISFKGKDFYINANVFYCTDKSKFYKISGDDLVPLCTTRTIEVTYDDDETETFNVLCN